jgi:hypothetical protein
VWDLVVFGDYKKLEKIFLVLSFLYIAYIITAFLANPDWLHVGAQIVRVPSWHEFKKSEYLYAVTGIIGATIAPWQQFYLQASVAEKGSGKSGLKYTQADAIVGSIFPSSSPASSSSPVRPHHFFMDSTRFRMLAKRRNRCARLAEITSSRYLPLDC